MNQDELIAIGQQLRVVREERGFSLEQVAAATRIRAKFLEGMEQGEVDPTLTEMQWRGFLRNYATYLHLDVDAMLWAYRQSVLENTKGRFGIFKTKTDTQPIVPVIPLRATATMPVPTRQTQELTAYTATPPAGRRWVGMLLLLLILGAGTAGILYGMTVVDEVTEETPVAPLRVEGSNSPTPAQTLTPDPKGQGEILYTATPSLIPTSAASGFIMEPPSTEANEPDLLGAQTVSIAIEATQRSWVRLEVDGVVQYEGVMRPNTSLQYQGQQSITLRTSNAAGLNVVVNNQALGVLGGRGELYENTFMLGAVIVPQVTPSPEDMPSAIETVDESRPEPILPVVPDDLQPTLTATPDPGLPTPIPTVAPIITEEVTGQ